MRKNERTEAKRVILEIIRQAGGELRGATNLYKAFYFAHLYYAETAPDYLTTWPIVRMPNGPGIDAGAELLRELEQAGHIVRKPVPVGPYWATTYRLTDKVWPGQPLPELATAAIAQAAKFVCERSATELSDITHEFSRSWKAATHDGDRLNPYIDLIAEDEYELRKRRIERNRLRLAEMHSNRETAGSESASATV